MTDGAKGVQGVQEFAMTVATGWQILELLGLLVLLELLAFVLCHS
jgi:hypothetical protein